MKEKKVPVDAKDDEPGGSSQVLAQKNNWYAAYKTSIQTIDELAAVVPFDVNEKNLLKQVAAKYHLRIPHYYLSLVERKDNAADPIRKQCVPSLDEIRGLSQEFRDPLAEEETSPIPHLVHRYPDRALLLVTGQCFMYCRHCTRKRLWWRKDAEPTLKEINDALAYVRSTKTIREIIVSGGDPLVLPTERLEYILSHIARIPTIEAIRIGTRAPVVLPQRIDEQLCLMLERFTNLWINVQFNHPREITPESTQACQKLQRCGIPLSNQSVLLKGINDDPAVMLSLCRKLQSIRVRPYYLFECDPVVGASHFRTSVLRGIEILEKMRGYTGGMCVPTFVVDGVHGKGKVPLGPNYLLALASGSVVLRNYKNEVFKYDSPVE